MADSDGKLDVVKLLTEDIQAHRDYIQRLYRNAAVVGGTGLLLAVAVGTWFLGRELNAAILQHSIDEQLITKMDALLDNRSQRIVDTITEQTSNVTAEALQSISEVAETAENTARQKVTATSEVAIAQARDEVDQYLSDQLSDEVRASIQPLLDQVSESSLDEIAQRLTIPAGFVGAFDRPGGCPSGWINMGEDWRGRTIVAAVATPSDRFAFGRTGGVESHSLTVDEMPAHRHVVREGANYRVGHPGEQRSSEIGVTRVESIGSINSSSVGGGSPHNNMPPYVALYYCKKT